MGLKCQMFINVIHAPLKYFEWFPDFVISHFRYKCTKLGRSVWRDILPSVFAQTSAKRLGLYKDLGQNIPPYRPPAQ